MFMLNDRIRFIDIFIENGFDVKVIVYIRRPVEFLASVWGERLKPCIPEKMQITLEQENDFYDIQFNTVLAFIDKIGAENVMVRPFEKEQWKNHSFVDDWLSCIVSYVIMQKLNYMDYSGATVIAFVMLVFSFLILLVINTIQVRQARRTNNV